MPLRFPPWTTGLAALSLISGPAKADRVTYTFSGVLDAATAQGSGVAPPGVVEGAAFTGSVTYEAATPPSSTNPPYYAGYADAVVDLRFMIASTTYSRATVDDAYTAPTSNGVDVFNDSPTGSPSINRDIFTSSLISRDDSNPAHSLYTSLGLSFEDAELNPTALNSTAIPTGPINVAKFGSLHQIVFTQQDYNSSAGNYNSRLFVRGQLSTFDLAPNVVPAPPAALMLGLGLLGVKAGLPLRRRD